MIADPNKRTLIIVESPTKAKTIRRYLPDTCQVVASKGHVVDLAPDPKTGVFGVSVDKGYELEYVIEDGKKKLLEELRKDLKDKEQLVLASDEDREGESISWHLLNQLKPKCPVYRMVFHEITRQAITNAFSNCRDIDMNLVHAQEARRAVDRLQGYGISPLLSRKLGGKYSAGRVQSPGLKLIVEREKARRSFVSSSYSTIDLSLEKDGSVFSASLEAIDGRKISSSKSFDGSSGELKDSSYLLSEKEAGEISAVLKGGTASVESVVNQDKLQYPAVPFTTSTLQQDASRKLHRSVKDIMSIAQTLYENGFITYMRTDSPTLSGECIKASREQVSALYGNDYLSSNPRNYKAKSSEAQEAHEAIRPAGDHFRLPSETGLSGDQLKLYTLIWRRTIATQMKEAEKSTTTVKLAAGRYTLSATGTSIRFPGFLKVYQASSDDEETEEEEGILPSLEAGCSVGIVNAEPKAHSTEPPARFNEASLVQRLENEGIGRPSTYASIISTLIDRKYVVRQGQALVPTFTGFFVDSFLENAFPVYIGYNFTSEMEAGLDRIAEGKESKVEFLDAFWKGEQGFDGLEKDLDNISKTVRLTDAKSLALSGLENRFCLEDGQSVAYQIKTGKFGPYLASDFIDASSGKEKMASIDQSSVFPGSFTDETAKGILFPPQAAGIAVYDDVFIMNGRYGEYFRRESDGKCVNIPKKRKAGDYSVDEVKLLFELPRKIGEDEEGNAVMLMSGPYGYFTQYKGVNKRASDPYSIDVDAIISDKKEPSNSVIADFGMLEEKPLQLLSGKYGPYIKWGAKNCALTADEKKDPSTITPERAREIALSAPEKKKTFRRKRS
ncbi:MAG: type I DNA topoisomerase [Candidatus Ornithospirochaeta sp.]|nr:type I DNA topoisomerase [Candidatus Ornithospirochaeta sp.]